jgi:hypothetical protein
MNCKKVTGDLVPVLSDQRQGLPRDYKVRQAEHSALGSIIKWTHARHDTFCEPHEYVIIFQFLALRISQGTQAGGSCPFFV